MGADAEETLDGSVCKECSASEGRFKRGSAAEPSQLKCSCRKQYASLDVSISANLKTARSRLNSNSEIEPRLQCCWNTMSDIQTRTAVSLSHTIVVPKQKRGGTCFE